MPEQAQAAPPQIEEVAQQFIESSPFNWDQAWLFLMCSVVAITIVQIRKAYFLGSVRNAKTIAVREFHAFKKVMDGKKRHTKGEKASLLDMEKEALAAKAAFDRAIGVSILGSSPFTMGAGVLMGAMFWPSTYVWWACCGFGALAALLQKRTYALLFEPALKKYQQFKERFFGAKPKDRSGSRGEFKTATTAHMAMEDSDEDSTDE